MSARDPISLLPLDVGFDLRPNMLTLDVADMTEGPLRYLDADQECTIDWHCPTLAGRVLRQAGYRPHWTWEAMPEGYLARIVTLPDGAPVLELRDPNDNLRKRWQYLPPQLPGGGSLRVRVLPDRRARWADEPGPPWWEPVQALPPPPSIITAWLLACGGDPLQDAMTVHVAAYTPNGREVRYAEDGGLSLQPAHDNYWHRCADLAEARRYWYSHQT